MALSPSNAEDLQTKAEVEKVELIHSNVNVEENSVASRARQLEKMRLAQQKFSMKLLKEDESDEDELDEETIAENNFINAFMESSHYSQQFTCPISKEPMRDPVSLEETGISYDRHMLATILLRESNPLCPVTRNPLPNEKKVSSMATNMALKNLISEAINAFKSSPEGQKYKDIKYEPMVMVERSVSPEQPMVIVGESVSQSLETEKKKVAVTIVSSTATFFASAGVTAKVLAAQGSSGCSPSVCCYSTIAGGAASWATTALCALGLFIIPSAYEKYTSSSPVQDGDPVAPVMEEENVLLHSHN